MFQFIKQKFGKSIKQRVVKPRCDHKYVYKTWLQDHKNFHCDMMFHKELVFRCSKCGHHRSLYTFDIEKEYEDLVRSDVEPGHNNFRFEIPRIVFTGNEAFALYKKYLKEGINLTEVEFD